MKSKFDYQGAKPLKRVKVTCHKCDHEWSTISDSLFVTCTSCLSKTRRIKL